MITARDVAIRDLNVFLIFKIDGKQKELKISAASVENLLAQTPPDSPNVIFTLEIKGKLRVLQCDRKVLEQLLSQTKAIAVVPKFLTRYFVDITRSVACKGAGKLVGRDHEIAKAWSCLGRPTRCNALLVGPAGVGKNRIVREMARRIVLRQAPTDFLGYRILEFDVDELLNIQKTSVLKKELQKVGEFMASSTNQVIIYVKHMIYMKYDENIMLFFYSMIKKWNVKIIGNLEEEHYQDYFAEDFEVAKYLNKIEVEEPEVTDLYQMVRSSINGLKKKYQIDISDDMVKFIIYTSALSQFNSATPGSTISVLQWAFSNAYRKGKKEIEKPDVLECYNTDLQLFEKAEENQKLEVAYHEIGHYIMHKLCNNIKDEGIAFVSILPMMDFYGVNWTYRIKGKQLNYSKAAYIDLIKIFLGGRVAEEIFSGELSDGASNDLEVANSLAEALIINFGLSSNEKQINRNYTSSGYFLKEYLFSESLKNDLNREIKTIIDEAYKEVKELLEANKGLLKLLAETLYHYEILTGEELESICLSFKKKVNKSKAYKSPKYFKDKRKKEIAKATPILEESEKNNITNQ